MRVPTVGFLGSATHLEQLPKASFPEVAFAGRSNVGKSSLINALVLRRRLAHVSAIPGRTRSINIYPVDGEWMLVDLPGYGFAQLPQQQRVALYELVKNYLLRRAQMALACILLDSRHDPTARDLAILEMLELHQRRFAVVLTKADTVSSSFLQERIDQVRNLVHQCAWCIDVLATSARTGEGRSSLWAVIRKAIAQHRTLAGTAT